MFLSMDECKHKLSLVRDFLCTEILPAKCSNCGNKVVRCHKTLGYLAEGIFALWGMPYIALAFVFIEHMHWYIFGTVMILLAGYIWDTVRTDPVIYTDGAKEMYRKRSTKTLIVTIVILLAVVVFGAYGT